MCDDIVSGHVIETGGPVMRFWETVGLILVLSAVGLTYEIAAGRVLAPFFGRHW